MAAAAAPSLSKVINAIGNLVVNVLALVTNLAAGPPVLPPGSTVTVARSTLQVGDTTVPADWYFPSGPEPPTGLIYFQHGAFAVASMYSYTAADLAEQTNSIVVAPTLSTNGFAPDGMWLGGTPLQTAVADLFVGDRAALTASASAAAGHTVTLPEHFVLAGHSLGGVFVTAVAGDLADDGAIDDLVGVVLFDPTPSAGQDTVMPTALAKLPGDLPVLLIGSPPSSWNDRGSAANALVAARPGQFVGVILDRGSHADSLQGGNPLIQLIENLVSGVPRPENIAATETLASGWIADMLAGTHDGIYVAPGEVFPIDTSAGTATAYALPDSHYRASPFQALLTALINFLTAGLGNEGSAGSAAVARLQTQL
jgi:alpha-beta hydrolase superfamily lysophospholipase